MEEERPPSGYFQNLDEAPLVFEATQKFIEAADWMSLMLTGNERRNSCTAGYKAMWSKREGYPSKEFLRALDPRLENIIEDKLSKDIYPIGGKAKLVPLQCTVLNVPNFLLHLGI